MKEITICYIPTDDNLADIMTKVLPSGARRDTLVERLLWDITSREEEKKKNSGSGNYVSKVSSGCNRT
jgi:hypothetical protein